MAAPDAPQPDASTFTSTGNLPGQDTRQRLLDLAYAHARIIDDGEASTIYPQLAAGDPDRFGLCLVGVDGTTHEAGDAHEPFAIMSGSKPFVFALVRATLGRDEVRARVGVDATGNPFNAFPATDAGGELLWNPMVNAGAIAITSLVPGADRHARWQDVRDMLDAFAGRTLELDEAMYESAMATNVRNRDIAAQLADRGVLGCSAREAIDRYTLQCSIRVTTEDYAVMGATLADGGVNPRTGVQVVDARTCRDVLAVMATAGMYEHSGRWLYDVGLPGKSGIGGGVVTVSPGKGALAAFSPRLDSAGNSVRGVAATRELARTVGLDLFASEAVDVDE